MSAHRGPLIYKNYKTAAAEFLYTSTTSDNCSLCAFLPLDRSHTKARVLHLALPVPLVSISFVPLLRNSSQIPDSDPYRGPGLYILCTILLCMLPSGAPYPVSNSASPSIGSIAACGFVGLPTPDLVSMFHATSSPFPMLLPGVESFCCDSAILRFGVKDATNHVGCCASINVILALQIILFSL